MIFSITWSWSSLFQKLTTTFCLTYGAVMLQSVQQGVLLHQHSRLQSGLIQQQGHFNFNQHFVQSATFVVTVLQLFTTLWRHTLTIVFSTASYFTLLHIKHWPEMLDVLCETYSGAFKKKKNTKQQNETKTDYCGLIRRAGSWRFSLCTTF